MEKSKVLLFLKALQTISHQNFNELIIIMDHNKIQSSQYVKKIIDLRDLKEKIKSFGWHVERCDGHNFKKIDSIFSKFKKIRNKPKFLIADTIKGKGLGIAENNLEYSHQNLHKNEVKRVKQIYE